MNGASDPNGAALLHIVEPIILSWVAHCRQLARIGGLAVNFKYLSHRHFSAAWQMLYGREILNVTVYPPPSVTPEIAQELIKEPPVESFAPPTPPAVEEPETPAPPEVPVHEDSVTPPEVSQTYLLVLFDNNKIMAIDMAMLKNLAKAKPFVGPKELEHSNWVMPSNNKFKTVGLSHGYRSDGSKIPVLPNTLQMTNSHTMGPVAIAGIEISGGVITSSEMFNVFRLQLGFDDSFPLSSYSHIGNVGFNGGFPSLMATDNMVYACNYRFTIEKGKLSLDSDDAWGYKDTLVSNYGYLGSYPEPFHPNFIDSSLVPYFDGESGNTYNSPALGALWFPSPPDDVLRHGTLFAPSLDQSSGLDVIRAQEVTASDDIAPFDGYGYPVTMHYAEYNISFVQEASVNNGRVQFDGVAFIVPYSVNNKHNYYVAGGVSELHTQFGQNRTGYNFNPGVDGLIQRAYGWEVFNGIMQVSNGRHNLQGYVIHDTSYSPGDDTWLPSEYFFYLDGEDVTAALASLCDTTPDKIQYAFMDVPPKAVLDLK